MIIADLFEDFNIPYDKNPTIGFWGDSDYVIGYHGTHERNIPIILKTGISKPDPKTGMVSITLDPNTAHGYAAMSGSGGEASFRGAGDKATTTPHNERAILKVKLPMEWVKQNMDQDFFNRNTDSRERLRNKAVYDRWRSENPAHPDHIYYQMSELRLKTAVPPNFIVGVMKRPMAQKQTLARAA
jgi:hypothetical protein